MFRSLIACVALLATSAAAQHAPAAGAAGLEARGLVRALNDATISSELPARITSLPLRDGESFGKGELLVDFDCERPKAEWRVADAERAGAQAAFDNTKRLAEYRAAGAHDVQMSRAALDKAQAAVDVIVARLKQCRILAPFDGRVVELSVREHEIPQAGQPLLRIVGHTRLELDMILPAASIGWLRQGAPLHFRPDSGGPTIEGEVLRVGAAIDPVSQTVRAVGSLRFKPGDLLPGQAGVVVLRRGGA